MLAPLIHRTQRSMLIFALLTTWVTGAAEAQFEPQPADDVPHSPQTPLPNKEAQKSEGKTNTDPEQIKEWIHGLDANTFTTRKAATVELIAVGAPMIEPLVAEMLDRGSLEQRMRGFEILGKLAVSKNSTDENVAYEALNKLASDTPPTVQTRALETLATIHAQYRDRALKQLRAQGAILTISDPMGRNFNMPNIQGIVAGTENGNRLLFNERWRGNAADLKLLKFVTGIEQIELQGDKITDEFLAAMPHCKSVRILKIRRAKITDVGFARLAGMPDLFRLDVRYTAITNESLATIEGLRGLREVRLFGTGIPQGAKKRLEASFPFPIAEIDIRQGGFLGVGAVNAETAPCTVNLPEGNSAAEEAGLLQNDIIVKYGDKDVATFLELKELISENMVGDEVTITIERGKKEIVKKVTLREWPDDK